MLNLAEFRKKVMLWLTTVVGTAIGVFGEAWHILYSQSIDSEIKRVNHMLWGIELWDEHKALARKYHIDIKRFDMPSLVMMEAVRKLERKKKNANYIRVGLIILGGSIIILALIWGTGILN